MGWRRLRSPFGDRKHNCYGTHFDRGVEITQKHPELGSICRVKLILKPPALELEANKPIIRAECVEIHSPVFSASYNCKDQTKAIQHAWALPLASLDRKIAAVKLKNLSEMSLKGASFKYEDELMERIYELIDRGHRAVMDAAQTTEGCERKLWTILPPQPCSSAVSTYTPKSEKDSSAPQVDTPNMQLCLYAQNRRKIPELCRYGQVADPSSGDNDIPTIGNLYLYTQVRKKDPRPHNFVPQAVLMTTQQPSSSSSSSSSSPTTNHHHYYSRRSDIINTRQQGQSIPIWWPKKQTEAPAEGDLSAEDERQAVTGDGGCEG